MFGWTMRTFCTVSGSGGTGDEGRSHSSAVDGEDEHQRQPLLR